MRGGSQGQMQRGRGRLSPEMMQQLIKDFDKGGDGRLNEEERNKARASMMQRGGPGGSLGHGQGGTLSPMMQRFDFNKDGVLNDDERAAGRREMQRRQ